MDAFELAQIKPSIYQHQQFVIATKHYKSIALAPVFSKRLAAKMIEFHVDTDQLGTFSGELERTLTPLQAARQKCLWALEKTDTDLAIGSEGSFGPHPDMPYINANHEILYLMDRKNNIELHVSSISTDIHYFSEIVSSLDELYQFAEQTRFPTFGLMMCPYPKQPSQKFFKGITSFAKLKSHFEQAMALSPTQQVWVESELRAHLNPKRMKHIEQLAHQLVDRLLSLCPHCNTPGWGKSEALIGLPCEQCGSATHQSKGEIYRCIKCHYQQLNECDEPYAEAAFCPSCNP